MGAPIDWNARRPSNSRVQCPSCGRGPKDKTCGVTIDGAAGISHCFRCDYVERMGRGVIASGVPLRRAVGPPRRETLSDYGRDLWNQCLPLSGVAIAYLRARNCVIPPADGDLRYDPAHRHPSGYIGPALVALVTHGQQGHAMSLHRTWVQADGTKAKVEVARMFLGGHATKGGVVRLWPADAVVAGLGIAEGIETALSLAHAFQPVWAALDAGHLCDFSVLPGIESLVIGTDHDEVGIDAAKRCGARWIFAGRQVRIVMPPQRGQDLNDIARA